MYCGNAWVGANSSMLDLVHRIEWRVTGLDGLDPQGWYLIGCNHQSLVDIPVLQKVFYRRIPFVKFFLKQELIWVPVLGFAWWALDFPFMKRYSREEIARRPELRGKDLETTRRACERFRHVPTSILNFLEGTRRTPGKHAGQQSPYTHLLRPKAGGIAFVIGAMGEMFNALLDVTIVYPDGYDLSFWDLLSGKVRRIVVHVEQRPIPAELLGGDYTDDPAFRDQFQAWVQVLWQEKDALIERLSAVPASSSRARL
jgi:1-acyl-sn-glycerol-3-phosphate acyltransferase